MPDEATDDETIQEAENILVDAQKFDIASSAIQGVVRGTDARDKISSELCQEDDPNYLGVDPVMTFSEMREEHERAKASMAE